MTTADQENQDSSNPPRRKRSLTSLTLEWVAERFRRKERIRMEVQSGSYTIASDKIAQRLVDDPE